jgi:hypothetical protein
MRVTRQEIYAELKGYRFTIPKGAEVTSQTACGIDEDYNFLTDFSFLPLVDGVRQLGLIHDLTYYGYNVPSDLIEEV